MKGGEEFGDEFFNHEPQLKPTSELLAIRGAIDRWLLSRKLYPVVLASAINSHRPFSSLGPSFAVLRVINRKKARGLKHYVAICYILPLEEIHHEGLDLHGW